MKDLIDMTEPELRALTNDLLATCLAKLPPGTHLTVLFWPFHRQEIGHYGSNAKRPEMIDALRETADRLERRQDVPR